MGCGYCQEYTRNSDSCNEMEALVSVGAQKPPTHHRHRPVNNAPVRPSLALLIPAPSPSPRPPRATCFWAHYRPTWEWPISTTSGFFAAEREPIHHGLIG